MNEVRYLSVEDVIALHDDILARMDFPASPLLDRPRLESAVTRCRNVAYYEGADLIRQSVILAVAISQSQAFTDGNKRVAFAAADVFLRINGLVYSGPPLELAVRLEAVAEVRSGATRDAKVAALEAWIRSHVVADKSFL